MTDPHLAAYAKGLEDAAQIAEEHGGWSLGPHVARCIRALSPLPPSTRVVAQVPPEGSAEWEALVERVALALASPDLSLVGDYGNYYRNRARAALRALTGGDDRD